MSTQGIRDYRPVLHYTPPTAWINDPNGLLFDGKIYHLFAQHHPDGTRHGPMHWLHATSIDLIHWRQLGIALAPDELGTIFSGSAVVDAGNTSGLGGQKDPLIAMFTHDGDTQQQSIAYSTDGVHFEKYENNPVIPNPGIRDFRDPKVFRNDHLNCWSVAIAAGERVLFYRSDNLIDWVKTGEFGAVENKMGGIFECPDCFPLTAPDGSTLWALTASMIQPEESGGSRTQVFLGDFDGYTFRETIFFPAPVLIDSGYDNYAAVTFSGTETPVMLGWGASWTYAADEPTNEYCGCMTLARTVSLIDTPKGPRLAFAPVLPPLCAPIELPSGGPLPGEVFVLEIEADGAFEACLENEKGEFFRFGLDGENRFYTDRSRSGEMEFNALYNSPVYHHTTFDRLYDGPVTLRLVFDRSIAELYADGGTYVNTTSMFPTEPYAALRLKNATARVSALQA